MPPRPAEDRLRDIVSAIEDIQAFMRGMAPETFLALPANDRRTYRALMNAIAEIGEAIKDLPDALTARHPAIDWRGFAALRNIVAHRYFIVDLPRLRPVLIDELPALLRVVMRELGGEPPPQSQ